MAQEGKTESKDQESKPLVNNFVHQSMAEENQEENAYLAYLKLLEENLEIYHQQNEKPYRNKEDIGWLRDYLDENGYYEDLEQFDPDEEDEEDEWPKLQTYLKEYKASKFDKEQLEEDSAILYDIIDCDMENGNNKKYFTWIKGNNRPKKIVEIFKKCSQNAYKKGGNFSTITDIVDVTVDDFTKISDKDKANTKKIYQENCAKICNKDMLADGSMITMLTISENKQMPFFQYIVDLYVRDTTKQGNETLAPSDWALKNEYIKKITKNYKAEKVLQIITAAISSFGSRVAPRLMTKNIDKKINDSVAEISDYIASAIQFTHWLANGAGTGSQLGQGAPMHQTVPFQVDFAFTFGDIIADDDKDDDEDDAFYDHFGAIGDKLDDAKVKKLSETVNDDEKNENDLTYFDLLKGHYIAWTRKEIKEDVNYKGYPRNHRFVCLIDRRKPTNDTAEYVTNEDEIHMFETPMVDDLATNKLVPNAQPLVFFDLSQRSVIPGKDKMSQDEDITDKTVKSTKTVKDACMSTLMVLSFHAMAVDEIKAYLYINGQVLRFFNEDIKNIIPKYFVENQENKDFDATPFIQVTKGKLVDTKFDEFHELYTNK